jgi:hypothetical protein
MFDAQFVKFCNVIEGNKTEAVSGTRPHSGQILMSPFDEPMLAS